MSDMQYSNYRKLELVHSADMQLKDVEIKAKTEELTNMQQTNTAELKKLEKMCAVEVARMERNEEQAIELDKLTFEIKKTQLLRQQAVVVMYISSSPARTVLQAH